MASYGSGSPESETGDNDHRMLGLSSDRKTTRYICTTCLAFAHVCFPRDEKAFSLTDLDRERNLSSCYNVSRVLLITCCFSVCAGVKVLGIHHSLCCLVVVIPSSECFATSKPRRKRIPRSSTRSSNTQQHGKL